MYIFYEPVVNKVHSALEWYVFQNACQIFFKNCITISLKYVERVSYPSVNLRLEFSQQVVQVLALVSNVMMCYRYLLLYYGMPCLLPMEVVAPDRKHTW